MHNADYTPLVGPALTVLGLSFQWLFRQFRNVSDVLVAIVAVLIAAGVYGVAHIFTPDWRLEVLIGIAVVAGYTANILGGTALAARIAGSAPETPVTLMERAAALVPKTDSK